MAIDNNCSKKQTFCSINGQTVRQNPTIAFSYDGCIAANEIVDNETWNELIHAIIKVYNYGTRGTRNPITPFSISPDASVTATTLGHETKPTNKISTNAYESKLQKNYNQINLSDYNKILSTIGATTLPDTSDKIIIYGQYFKDVMNKLNNYTLNNTRCNNCNAGCNVTCQAIAQCCDSHCCTQCCTDCCTNCCTNAASSETWWCGSNSCGNNGCYRTQ